MLGLLASHCSKSKPPPEKEAPPVDPFAPLSVKIGALLRDQRGIYDGRVVQTTGSVLSFIQSTNQPVVLRLTEPGAPVEGPDLFCVLLDPPSVQPAMGELVSVRGNKRGNGIGACEIVLDAGH